MFVFHFREGITVFEFLRCQSSSSVCAATNRKSSVSNGWHRRYISNTVSYSISSRRKQLFKIFRRYRHARNNFPSFHSCIIYNSLIKPRNYRFYIKSTLEGWKEESISLSKQKSTLYPCH